MQLMFTAILFSPTGSQHDNQCSLQAWKGVKRTPAGGRPTLEFSGGDAEGKVGALSPGKRGSGDSWPTALKLVILFLTRPAEMGTKGRDCHSSVLCTAYRCISVSVPRSRHKPWDSGTRGEIYLAVTLLC